MEVFVADKSVGTDLIVGHLVIEAVENRKNRNGRMDKAVSELQKRVKENPGMFLEHVNIKRYEEFIGKGGNDSQPAPKILIGMILNGGYLPVISRAVDCMNIVSVETGLTISMWDKDRIHGDIRYVLSNGGERYWPFMGEEEALKEGELIALDDEKVLCLVRYRDSKYAPVTLETRNIVVHIQGVGGITAASVQAALDELEGLLLENVGGATKEKRIYGS